MDWGGPTFVVLLVAISTLGWLGNNWIRAKHGYSLENEWGGMTDPADSDEAKRLRSENQQMRQLMERMEDRMIVLERIVTDKGYTVAEEIEALRDRPSQAGSNAGAPMGITRKEEVQ